MPPVVDLIGKVFGRLTVLERAESFKQVKVDGKFTGAGGTRWVCRCQCGNEKTIAAAGLRNGLTRSCGCLAREVSAAIGASRAIDLTGHRSGRLLVEGIDLRGKRGRRWNCICDCGVRCVVYGADLRDSHTQSCGCLRVEHAAKIQNHGVTPFVDLLGQRFGRLLVTGKTDARKNEQIVWRCACDCGREALVRGADLRNEHTKSCGCLAGHTKDSRAKEAWIGRSFGVLTIVDEAHAMSRGRRRWECLCECGRACIVDHQSLRNGNTTRCNECGPRRPKVTVGDRFRMLTVVSRERNNQRGNSRWLCRCDCGDQIAVGARHLIDGRQVSCGCWRRTAASRALTTHGKSGTTTWRIWYGMKQRCSNPRGSGWEDYGGRGITVCNRWRDSFENFLADMGERPDAEHSLDRIDPNGNYEPGNVRWATRKVQCANKRLSAPRVAEVLNGLKAKSGDLLELSAIERVRVALFGK